MKKKYLVLLSFFLYVFCFSVSAQWKKTNYSSTSTITDMTVYSRGLVVGTFGSGISISTDGSDNWVTADSGLSTSYIYSLISKDTLLFAGTYHYGIFRSLNNGTSWSEANIGLTNYDILSFAFQGEDLFAGTGTGVFLSTDYGLSWSHRSSTNNPYGFSIGQYNIFSLVATDLSIYAGCAIGLYLSTDKGLNWSSMDLYADCLGIHNGYLFVNSYSDVLFSTNNGESWVPINNSLVNKSINAFLVNGNDIYMGTDGGIFKSTDNGMSWSSVNYGLTSYKISALAICDSNIYAAIGKDIWKASLSDDLTLTDVEVNNLDTSNHCFLSNNYPNPFNPTTKIKYSVTKGGFVSLKVFDINSREVTTLVNGYKSIGEYEIIFDASNLASGIYFYQLKTSNYLQTKKLVLLK